MAYRCKCCGYIFKSSDSDLCPECFTARDDTKCSDMERGHTHFKERSKEKNDFLDDQLREERKAAKEDFGEDYNIRDDSAKTAAIHRTTRERIMRERGKATVSRI